MTTLIVLSVLLGLPVVACIMQRIVDGRWPEWSRPVTVIGKWLWDNKSRKSVWLTATLAFLGALVALCYWIVKRALRNPDWISNLPWFWIMVVLTPFIFIIEALLVILVWQGAVTKKTLAKIHLWVLGVLGVIGFIVYLFFAPWARIWGWINAHASGIWSTIKANPIPWLVGLAVVLVIILWIVKKKGHHAPAATSSGGHGAHGGHGHGGHGGGGFGWGKALVVLVILSFITTAYQSMEFQEQHRRSQWAASDSNGRHSLVTHGFVLTFPDREVPIYTPEGMAVTTVPTHPNEKVWVRYDGEEPFLNYQGRTNTGVVMHQNLRSRFKFLRSAETFPVTVEWTITPLSSR